MRLLELCNNEISLRFNKAARNYCSIAHIQAIIAQDLIANVPEGFKLAMDLGCGPGVNFKELLKHTQSIIGIDLAEAMVSLANAQNIPNTHSLIGNAEEIPLDNQGFDLVFSSLALQWCSLSKALKEIKRVSKPNCFVAISLPILGTLKELQGCFNDLKLGTRINNFLNEKQINEILIAIGLTKLKIEVKNYKDCYTDSTSYLASIRAIGANSTNSKHPKITRNQYQQLMTHLNSNLQLNGKLEHTYRIAFILGTIA